MLDEDVDGVQLWSRRMKTRILIVYAKPGKVKMRILKMIFAQEK